MLITFVKTKRRKTEIKIDKKLPCDIKQFIFTIHEFE